MARECDIGGDDNNLFIGEDKIIREEVLDEDDIPVNINGWSMRFDVKLTDKAEDPALLSLIGTITGTYSTTRSANTQRVLYTIVDDDLDGDDITGRKYRFSTKRTDTDRETVITFGDFFPKWAPTR